MSDFLAPKPAEIFRGLVVTSNFPIPKCSSPSRFHLHYRPISITPIICKVYEKLISRRLYRFVESIKVFSTIQFGTTDVHLLLTHYL